MHLRTIDPDLILQAVIETLESVPARHIKKLMIIPGAGNNSSSKRGGIQSCLVSLLLKLFNINVGRIEGKYNATLDN